MRPVRSAHETVVGLDRQALACPLKRRLDVPVGGVVGGSRPCAGGGPKGPETPPIILGRQLGALLRRWGGGQAPNESASSFPCSADAGRAVEPACRGRGASPVGPKLQRQLLGGFPGKRIIITAKVAISCSLLHHWSPKLQITHNAARAKIKVGFNNFD